MPSRKNSVGTFWTGRAAFAAMSSLLELSPLLIQSRGSMASFIRFSSNSCH